MKLLYILMFIFLFTPRCASSQFLVLNKDDSVYNLKHYVLNTKELYNTDFNIEVFNVIYPEQHNQHERILLVTVLPDVLTGELWEEIESKDVENKTIEADAYCREIFPLGSFNNNMLALKTLNKIRLLKKENNKVWVSKNCLVEAFEIIQEEPVFFSSLYGQLALNQGTISIQDFVKQYSPSTSNQIDGSALSSLTVPGQSADLNGWRVWKEFLSRKVTINDREVGYQFWTSAKTNVADNYDVSQGIGRFVYVPTRGIVGGSYDFYFRNPPGVYRELVGKKVYTHQLTNKEWYQAVLNEKIMTAEGIVID